MFSTRRSSFLAASLLMPLCLCPLRGALLARAQTVAAPQNPDAIILSIRGDRATLSIGQNRGVQVGAIYGVTREGQIRVSLRILEVGSERSTAQLLSSDTRARFAVGDAVQFIALGQTPFPAAPGTPATAPSASATAPSASATAPSASATAPSASATVPGTPATAPGASPATPMMPVSAAPVASANVIANVIAVAGETVTLDIGALQGLTAGRNLPLLRGGEAIGMVRVQSVSPNSSQARVIWKDDAIAAVVAGDSVQIPSGATQNPIIIARNDAQREAEARRDEGFRPVAGSDSTPDVVPLATVRFETGASNINVPRAERTYELLAALAASGTISRYPASLFADEGTRFHRTAEDLTFSRAQIADLVREAMEKSSSDEVSGRDRLILGELARDFAPELRQLGVAAPVLAAYAPEKGLRIGISGQQRYNFVGGDKDDFRVPFSERQGGSRTRSGLDSRTNIFGRAGRAAFFTTLDAGGKTGERIGGLGDAGREGFQVRRALFSYQASGVSSRLRGLTLEAGRNEVWLGPGHFGTLLLGDTAGPLNQIGYKFQRGALSVRGLYAPLDNGPQRTGQRSLYVRDTKFQLGSQASIGFSESVFVPRDKFDPALFATVFSPVPLFITQRRGKEDSDETSNLLQSFYAEASLARGVRAYGELLVDDIGVNSENLALNRIGTLLGGHLFTPRDPAKLGIYGEFARLAGRTYLRFGNFDPDYDYYYRSRPLGYPVAPTQTPGLMNLPSLGGAESLRLEAYYRPIAPLRLTASAELADLNSERLDLSRQQTYRFSATYSFSQALALSVRAQRVSTSQPGFVIGAPTVKQELFQVELSRAF